MGEIGSIGSSPYIQLNTGVTNQQFVDKAKEKFSDGKLTPDEFKELASMVSGGETSLKTLVKELDFSKDIENIDTALPTDIDFEAKSKLISLINGAVPAEANSVGTDVAVLNLDEIMLDNDTELKPITDALSGLWISDQDVSLALDKLQELNPEKFRDAINSMGEYLGYLTTNMNSDHRERFISMAVDKGYLQEIPEKHPEPVKSGAPNPPSLPALIGEGEMRPEIRDIVLQNNQEKLEEYADKYNTYSNEYRERVSECNTPEQLRALGRDSKPILINDNLLASGGENGWFISDSERGHQSVRDSLGSSQYHIHEDLGGKMMEWRFGVDPGTFSASVEVQDSTNNKPIAPGQGIAVNVVESLNIGVDQTGRISTPQTAGGVEITNGFITRSERVETTRTVESVKLEVPDTASISLSSDGGIEATMTGLSGHGISVSSVVSSNVTEGTFSAGYQFEAELPNGKKVSVSPRISFQSITGEQINWALNSDGFDWED